MGDKVQQCRDGHVDEALNQGAGIGWDPYQVWLTRIRPQQGAFQPAAAQAVASQRPRRAARMFFRFNWRSSRAHP
jgi:hypothetical protein